MKYKKMTRCPALHLIRGFLKAFIITYFAGCKSRWTSFDKFTVEVECSRRIGNIFFKHDLSYAIVIKAVLVFKCTAASHLVSLKVSLCFIIESLYSLVQICKAKCWKIAVLLFHLGSECYTHSGKWWCLKYLRDQQNQSIL